MKPTTTKQVTVKQVTLRKPSHVASAADSERKLDFLRRLYRAAQLDVRLSSERKVTVMQRLCDKAAWHKANIAAYNRVTSATVMEYPTM